MKRVIDIKNDMDELNRVRDEVQAFLGDSFDRLDTNRLVLSVDEALANILEHAYEDHELPASQERISLTLFRDADAISFILEDDGPVFDPTELPDPDLEAEGRNTKDGGLGVHLYTTLMDSVRHEALGPGRGNRLTLVKHLP